METVYFIDPDRRSVVPCNTIKVHLDHNGAEYFRVTNNAHTILNVKILLAWDGENFSPVTKEILTQYGVRHLNNTPQA